jgi:hypothetical protein
VSAAANGQRQGLTTTDATHAGGNRHEHRKRHHLVQRGFEQTNNPGGEKCREKIDPEPECAAADTRQNGGEQVCFSAVG